MNILVNNNLNDLPISNDSVISVIQAFVDFEQIPADEISINFVDTETICSLHADYFDDPSPTDCISFPLDDEEEEYRVLGEVFVCPKTAQEYASSQGTDPYLEVTLYVIHGLLHLIGFDDLEDRDRLEMRKKEEDHLQNLKNLKLGVKKK